LTTPNVGGAYWTNALTQTAVKTSAYTANPNELVRVDTTSGSVTVTLPAQPAAGTIVAVKMVTLGGSNTVTVSSVAGDVYNKSGGSTSATLSLLSQGIVLEYQSGIWMVLADDIPLSQIDSRYMPTPTGTATSGQVPVATGTGEASAWGNVATNPMTTSGDTIYGGSAGAPTRLAGDTSNTRKFLREQSTAGTANPPAWDTLQAGDLPGATTSTQGAVILDGTAGDIAALGAQAAGSVGKAADAGHVHPTTGVVLTSSLPLAIGSGGSGQATAAAAYNALSPMTTTGDIEYESGANTASRLAGPTSATKQFLTSTGTGSAANAPAWATIAAADLPTGTTSTKGALQLDGTAGDIAALGAQAAGAIGKAADAGHVHPTTGVLPTSGGTMAGNIAMGSNSVTGLANGVNPADAMNMSQMFSGFGPSPASFGLAMASIMPFMARGTLGCTNEQWYAVRCTAYKTGNVTFLGVWLTTAGVTAGAGVNRLALYSATGTLLQQTGDLTTAFQSTGITEGAITSQAVTAGTDYWLALLTSFTGTVPQVAQDGLAGSLPAINGLYTVGTLATQATVPASFTPSSAAGATSGAVPFLYGR